MSYYSPMCVSVLLAVLCCVGVLRVDGRSYFKEPTIPVLKHMTYRDVNGYVVYA